MKNSAEHIITIMEKTGLIPVFNHQDIEVTKKVLDASYEAGIRVFEFTNRNEKALSVFTELRKHALKYNDLILGIGTIFTKTEVEQFLNAQADFIVSPALIPEIANYCNKKEVLWVPGCATVTEVYSAQQLGAKLIKAFPGNVLGVDFIKAIKTVLPKTKIMPTGGVQPSLENLRLWFDSGVSCVGMGSLLFSKNNIKNNDFLKLSSDIKEVLVSIKEIKNN
ncbi:bifunctional 4-hydroxy-2-oxoglutarate aldolase/2-dehydro-3-deoxy-phosphogluconate aldolase [Aquimarina sp. AD1]|uniref:bifunctional 4-hydroxy-2-oxoglutarate aldolase/2-dehydro-3-deoxy-phosphogluconate aldolase n=1 Tax=Aquimarina sp. (strain AD1) TaxID=1714848 RepID=UPI000E4DD36A|nr:bifunctional 4-hydroxy-2-oxoglutarate aldolase/2-dehydro-3-deoxy-phosphogluconate aldolase [Aquimarina sp. AD1]AXT57657.1 bifunctional 4-hydroxy-2-oxoglutarate aldolase/2-dehydro-3-deoxy-phosphogluconate aldolase [Aquimarina sp. AD1]RKN19391.1 bifunctional 4-hydroxy-2-oxoglutarate aldolase/2-dehydro-3-deoxy-phosphogluconate aldolase [Aquimarina sp. AD1]